MDDAAALDHCPHWVDTKVIAQMEEIRHVKEYEVSLLTDLDRTSLITQSEAAGRVQCHRCKALLDRQPHLEDGELDDERKRLGVR